MTFRPRLLLEALSAAVLAALVLSAVGSGHGGGTYYDWKFMEGDRFQTYGFDGDVPTGDHRDRVEDGAREWNALAPDLRFSRGGSVTWTFGTACNQLQNGDNSIHWGGIDGGPGGPGLNTYATTMWCLRGDNPDKLALFRIKYDSAETYYRGTGSVPSNKVDTWGLSAHEFGHAGGFGSGDSPNHFPGDAGICDLPGRQTMCQGLPHGAGFWRSLEEHDRHTFRDAY